MLTFLARRLLQLIPTLFFVTVIIFLLQQLLPGDPALVMAGEEKDPAVIARNRQSRLLGESACIAAEPDLDFATEVVGAP